MIRQASIEAGRWTGRTRLFHVVLFCVAYLLFLTRYWLSEAEIERFDAGAVVQEWAKLSADGRAARDDRMPADVDHQKTGGASTLESASVARKEENGGVSRAAADEDGLSMTSAASMEAQQQERARLAGLVADATHVDSQIRAVAILRLGAAPLQQALPALQTALIADQQAKNRQFAIASLRKLAKQQGDESGAVRMLLQQAMSDADAGVAQSAQAAYEDLAHSLP